MGSRDYSDGMSLHVAVVYVAAVAVAVNGSAPYQQMVCL